MKIKVSQFEMFLRGRGHFRVKVYKHNNQFRAQVIRSDGLRYFTLPFESLELCKAYVLKFENAEEIQTKE